MKRAIEMSTKELIEELEMNVFRSNQLRRELKSRRIHVDTSVLPIIVVGVCEFSD